MKRKPPDPSSSPSPPPADTTAESEHSVPEGEALEPGTPAESGESSEYLLPDKPPSATSVRDLAAWDALIDTSIDRTTTTAGKWQAGLAGFVGVITSILIFEGPGAAQDIPESLKPWIIWPLAAGTLLLLVGLWFALTASAPSSPRRKYADVIRNSGTVRAQTIHAAIRSNSWLKWAKGFVGVALVVLLVGVFAWLWVPPEAKEPGTVISVDTGSGVLTCGTFSSFSDGYVLVRPPKSKEGTKGVVIRLDDAVSIKVVGACPD